MSKVCWKVARFESVTEDVCESLDLKFAMNWLLKFRPCLCGLLYCCYKAVLCYGASCIATFLSVCFDLSCMVLLKSISNR